MSAFDDFNAESFADAGEIIGMESFTITNITGSFEGILNEFGSVKSLEIGGIVGEYVATVVCYPDQFSELSGPLERTLDGRRLVIAGRDFKITRVFLDECAVTLGLTNPSGKK